MKIGKKILLGFTVMIVLGWIIGLITIVNSYKVDKFVDDMIDEGFTVLVHNQNIQSSVQKIYLKSLEIVFFSDDDSRQESTNQLQNYVAELEKIIKQEPENQESEESEPAVSTHLVENCSNFTKFVNEFVAKKGQNESKEVLNQYNDKFLNPAYLLIISALDTQTSERSGAYEKSIGEIDELVDFGRAITFVISILVLLVGIFLARYMGRSISNPIESLTNTAEDISNGNLDLSVQKMTNDEIGDLSLAFEKMRLSLKAMIAEFKK